MGRRRLRRDYAEDRRVRRELNILALIKGNERYVFIYDDDSRESLIDTFRDHAADPQFSFSWYDAAVLTDKAREQARTAPDAKDCRM
jgi:hypothetical protein